MSSQFRFEVVLKVTAIWMMGIALSACSGTSFLNMPKSVMRGSVDPNADLVSGNGDSYAGARYIYHLPPEYICKDGTDNASEIVIEGDKILLVRDNCVPLNQPIQLSPDQISYLQDSQSIVYKDRVYTLGTAADVEPQDDAEADQETPTQEPPKDQAPSPDDEQEPQPSTPSQPNYFMVSCSNSELKIAVSVTPNNEGVWYMAYSMNGQSSQLRATVSGNIVGSLETFKAVAGELTLYVESGYSGTLIISNGDGQSYRLHCDTF